MQLQNKNTTHNSRTSCIVYKPNGRVQSCHSSNSSWAQFSLRVKPTRDCVKLTQTSTAVVILDERIS